MDQSDLVLLACPVYFAGFPAPLKAVIDRAQQRFGVKFGDGKGVNQKIHRGGLIATCGSPDTGCIKPLEQAARMFFDCFDLSFSERLYAINTDHPDQMKITDHTIEQKKGCFL